jgi:hypothetical protein
LAKNPIAITIDYGFQSVKGALVAPKAAAA